LRIGLNPKLKSKIEIRNHTQTERKSTLAWRASENGRVGVRVSKSHSMWCVELGLSLPISQ